MTYIETFILMWDSAHKDLWRCSKKKRFVSICYSVSLQPMTHKKKNEMLFLVFDRPTSSKACHVVKRRRRLLSQSDRNQVSLPVYHAVPGAATVAVEVVRKAQLSAWILLFSKKTRKQPLSHHKKHLITIHYI